METVKPKDTSVLDQAKSEELALEIRGLVKSFAGRTVINSVNLEVPQGCSFGYLGPNGAGKTTLMRVVLGLSARDSGTIRINGRDVSANRKSALSKVGAIIEEPRFYKNLNAIANLEILAAARGGDTYKKILDSLDTVDLIPYAKNKVGTYSMGMRQRLGIAACLMADPKLILLDEPMNGLDPAGMNALRELIARLVAEGRSVLLSSHLLDEVEKTCDYIAILDDGQVVLQGRLSDIIATGDTDIVIECSEPEKAFALLSKDDTVRNCKLTDTGLTYSLSTDNEIKMQIGRTNNLLVQNQIMVYGLSSSKHNLEQRFLELTKRLGEATNATTFS